MNTGMSFQLQTYLDGCNGKSCSSLDALARSDLIKDEVALLAPEAVVSLITMRCPEAHMSHIKSVIILHNRGRTHLIKILKLKV